MSDYDVARMMQLTVPFATSRLPLLPHSRASKEFSLTGCTVPCRCGELTNASSVRLLFLRTERHVSGDQFLLIQCSSHVHSIATVVRVKE